MLKFDSATHTYEYMGKRLVSVTQVLQGVGLIDFSGISPDVLQRAADFGSAAHLATALDDQGDLDEETLDENLKPYLEAWRAFRGDMKFDAIEQPLCHPDYGLAGCPDRICRTVKDNSEYPTIIDLKTGSIVPAWTGLQLAGYAILADLPAARRIAVQLKGDGTFQVHEYTDRKNRAVFLSCLAIYNWKINNGSR